MTTVTIIFTDTPDGLVAVDTTVEGWSEASNAQALADRVCSYMGEIAQEKEVAPANLVIAG